MAGTRRARGGRRTAGRHSAKKGATRRHAHRRRSAAKRGGSYRHPAYVPATDTFTQPAATSYVTPFQYGFTRAGSPNVYLSNKRRSEARRGGKSKALSPRRLTRKESMMRLPDRVLLQNSLGAITHEAWPPINPPP